MKKVNISKSRTDIDHNTELCTAVTELDLVAQTNEVSNVSLPDMSTPEYQQFEELKLTDIANWQPKKTLVDFHWESEMTLDTKWNVHFENNHKIFSSYWTEHTYGQKIYHRADWEKYLEFIFQRPGLKSLDWTYKSEDLIHLLNCVIRRSVQRTYTNELDLTELDLLFQLMNKAPNNVIDELLLPCFIEDTEIIYGNGKWMYHGDYHYDEETESTWYEWKEDFDWGDTIEIDDDEVVVYYADTRDLTEPMDRMKRVADLFSDMKFWSLTDEDQYKKVRKTYVHERYNQYVLPPFVGKFFYARMVHKAYFYEAKKLDAACLKMIMRLWHQQAIKEEHTISRKEDAFSGGGCICLEWTKRAFGPFTDINYEDDELEAAVNGFMKTKKLAVLYASEEDEMKKLLAKASSVGASQMEGVVISAEETPPQIELGAGFMAQETVATLDFKPPVTDYVGTVNASIPWDMHLQFNKPMKIATINWTANSPLNYIGVEGVVASMSDKWLARRFLEGFKLVKYRWKFIIGFNSTIFHQGLMKVTLLQRPMAQVDLQWAHKARSMPGIEFQANEPGTYTLESEFSSRDEMWELANPTNQELRLGFLPLVPLTCPSTGSQTLAITVLAQMIDYEMAIPIPRQPALLNAKERELPQYSLKKILLQRALFVGQSQGHAASNLKKVTDWVGGAIRTGTGIIKPVIDAGNELADAVKPITDIVGPVMGVMGGGNATMFSQATGVAGPMPGRNITGGVGNFDHVATNVTTDFDDLKKLRTVSTIIEWSTSTTAGAQIAQFPITNRGLEINGANIHPIGIMSTLCQFSRGSINFHIRAVKNKILTGKLKVMVFPPRAVGGKHIVYDQDSYEFAAEWLDLSENSEVNITVPYAGSLPYKRCLHLEDPPAGPGSDEAYLWGTLAISVVNPLLTNSAEFSTVPLIIETSFGDNYEMVEPNTLEFLPTFFFSSEDAPAIDAMLTAAEDVGESQMSLTTSGDSTKENTTNDIEQTPDQISSKLPADFSQMQTMKSWSQLVSRNMPFYRGVIPSERSMRTAWNPAPFGYYTDGAQVISNNAILQMLNKTFGKWKGNIEYTIWTNANHLTPAEAIVEFTNEQATIQEFFPIPHYGEPIPFNGTDDELGEFSQRGRKNLIFNLNRTPSFTFTVPYVSQTDFLEMPPTAASLFDDKQLCSLPLIRLSISNRSETEEINFYMSWRMSDDAQFVQYSGLGEGYPIPAGDSVNYGISPTDAVFPAEGGFWTQQFGQMYKNLTQEERFTLRRGDFINVLRKTKRAGDHGVAGALDDVHQFLLDMADDVGESQMEVTTGFYKEGVAVMSDQCYKLFKEEPGTFHSLYHDTFQAILRLGYTDYGDFCIHHPVNVGVSTWKVFEKRTGNGEEFDQHVRNLVVRFHGLSGIVNGSWTPLGKMFDEKDDIFDSDVVKSLSEWNNEILERRVDLLVEDWNEREGPDSDMYECTARPLPYKLPGIPTGAALLVTTVGRELRGEIEEGAAYASIYCRDRTIGNSSHCLNWLTNTKDAMAKWTEEEFLRRLLGEHYIPVKNFYPTKDVGMSQMMGLANLVSGGVPERAMETMKNANNLLSETHASIRNIETNINELTKDAHDGVRQGSRKMEIILDNTQLGVTKLVPLIDRLVELTDRFKDKSVIEGLTSKDFLKSGPVGSVRRPWGLTDNTSVTLSHILVDIVNYFYSPPEQKDQAIWNGIAHFLVSTGLHVNALIDGVSVMKDYMSKPAPAEQGLDGHISQIGIESISNIGAALSVFLGLAVYHKIPEGEKLEKQLTKLSVKLKNIGFAGNGFRALKDVFYPMIKTAITAIISCFMEEENPELEGLEKLEAQLPKISEWYKKASLMEPSLVVSHCMLDSQKKHELAQMIQIGAKYENQLMTMKNNVQVAVSVRTVMVKLVKILDEVNKMKRSARFRYDPFCIFHVGEPGIGKSWISSKLATDLGNYFRVDPDNLFYSRSNTDHWDNYTKQFWTYFDDFGQITDDLQFAEFIGIKSEAPFPLKMADLNSKGTTFESPMVLCSSNNGYAKPKTLYSAEAYYRRRNLMVRVRFTGRVVKGEKVFEQDLSHLTFDIMDPYKNQQLRGPDNLPLSFKYPQYREFVRIRSLMYFDRYYKSCEEKGTSKHLIPFPKPEYEVDQRNMLISGMRMEPEETSYTEQTAEELFMYLEQTPEVTEAFKQAKRTRSTVDLTLRKLYQDAKRELEEYKAREEGEDILREAFEVGTSQTFSEDSDVEEEIFFVQPPVDFRTMDIKNLQIGTQGESYGFGPVSIPYAVCNDLIKLSKFTESDGKGGSDFITYMQELSIKIPMMELYWTTYSMLEQEQRDEYISKAYTTGDMSDIVKFNKELDKTRLTIAQIYMDKYENMFHKYPVLVTIITGLGLVTSVYGLLKLKKMATNLFSNKDEDIEEEQSSESSIGRRDPNNMGRQAAKRTYTRMRPELETFKERWNKFRSVKVQVLDENVSECDACPVINTMIRTAEAADEKGGEQLWLDSIMAMDTIVGKVACHRCKNVLPALKRLEELLKATKEKARGRLSDFSSIRSSVKALAAWCGIGIIRLIDRLAGVADSELAAECKCKFHQRLDLLKEHIEDLVEKKEKIPLSTILFGYKLINRSWPTNCTRCEEYKKVDWADGFEKGFKTPWAQEFVRQLLSISMCDVSTEEYEDAGKSEGCPDENMMSIKPLIDANLWSVESVYGNMNALFLRGTIAIMPLHFKSWVKDDTLITLSQNKVQQTARWMMRNIIKEFPFNDLMIVNLGEAVKPHKCIVKHFIKDADLRFVDKIPGVLSNRAKNTGELERVGLGAIFRQTQPVKHALNGKESLCVRAASYKDSFTQAGQCGGPVMIMSTRTPRKVLGVHIAGTPGGLGTCAIITQELIEEVDWNKLTSQFHIGSLNGIPKPEGVIYDEEIIKERQMIFVPEYTNLAFVGLAPQEYIVRMPQKTTLEKSPLYGIYPATVAPAILHPGDPRFERVDEEGRLRMSPSQQGVDGWGMKVIPFMRRHIDEAVRMMILDNEALTPLERPRRVFQIDEVVNLGIDASPVANRMEMTTSPGLPWVNKRPPGAVGKEFLFDKSEMADGSYYFTPKEELRKAIEDRIAAYRRGERPVTVWCDMLKDEKLKLEKVKSGRTRNFVIAPVDFNIVMRMYFRDYVLNQQEQCVKAESKIGLNPLGPQWTAIAMRAFEIGSKFMAGDYSKFDRSETAEHILSFADVVNAWYNDGPENARIRKLICEECTHRLTVCGTTMYETAGGMPSGCDCTTPCNGHGGGLNIRVGYLAIGEFLIDGAPEEFIEALPPHAAIKFKETEARVQNFSNEKDIVPVGAHTFNNNVRAATMGDDIFAALSDNVVDYFNFQTYRAFLGMHGVIFTPETKTKPEEEPMFKKIEDLTFLKRKFVSHPMSSLHLLAPLEWNVIQQEVQWIHKCEDVQEMTEQVVDASVRDAMHHGEEVFTQHLELMNKGLIAAGMKPNYHSYGALEREWFLKFK